MAPVIQAFQQHAPWADCRVLVTAQHRELLDQMLAFFGISPDVDLDAMRASQTLADLTARLLTGVDGVLGEMTPDIVLAQGDTTTVLATALAAFYRRIPFAHVEAGLRTHQLSSPFPEEANRVLAGRLAALHFAPTEAARANLLREGIAEASIHMTGNPVIDALFLAVERKSPIGVELTPGKRLVLVTAHRRDSFGEPLRHICHALAALAHRFADVEFLWPVHPNPAVRAVVDELLCDRTGIRLCEPLDYGSFVSALKRCHLVLTDSGGVQEEAPALGKPVLVLREQSERPEAIEAGVARLVGTDRNTIVREASRLLTDKAAYARMSVGASPYGDGKASLRMVEAAGTFLGIGLSAARAAA